MDNQSRWKKLLPHLAKGTGVSAMFMITMVTIAELMSQSGPQVALPILVSFLSSLFGDAVAGPIIERLLNSGDEDEELKSLTQKFDELIEKDDDIRKGIASILSQQDSFVKAIGTAFQYHEDKVVGRILKAAASYQDFGLEKLAIQISNQLATEIKRLDPEIQYLIDLIANLQRIGGVWKEYIDLPVSSTLEQNPSDYGYVSQMGLPRIYRLLEDAFANKEEILSDDRLVRFDSIEEIVKQYPRIVLLGEPGSGKTTTIQHLALEMARKRLSANQSAPIPMILRLSLWGENQTIEEFIRSNWRLTTDPLGLLSLGKLHLSLDGLNEMGKEGKLKAEDLRRWLNSDHAPVNIILSCRTMDYSNEFELNIHRVVVDELDNNLIQRFVHNYLNIETDIFLQKLTTKKDSVNDQRELIHLARNPFLLTALIVVYKSSPTKELPKNLGFLFSQLVKVLWEREQQRRSSTEISAAKLEESFGQLAFSMINRGKPTNVSFEYVLEIIGSKELITIGENASILQLSNNEVRFLHQLLQEYFAATQLIKLNERDLINLLPRPMVNSETGLRKARKWDWVVVAGCGLENPTSLLKIVANIDPYLIVPCIRSGIIISKEILDEVTSTLTKILLNPADIENNLLEDNNESLDRDKKKRFYDEITGEFDDREFYYQEYNDSMFIIQDKHYYDEDGFVSGGLANDVYYEIPIAMRLGAAEALGAIGNNLAIYALENILSDQNEVPVLREAAAKALGNINDPTVIPLLLSYITSAYNSLLLDDYFDSTYEDEMEWVELISNVLNRKRLDSCILAFSPKHDILAGILLTGQNRCNFQ